MKISKKAAIKLTQKFIAVGDMLSHYPDDNPLVIKLVDACKFIDRLVDRFDIDLSSLKPIKFKTLSKNKTLDHIISYSLTREIPPKNGVIY